MAKTKYRDGGVLATFTPPHNRPADAAFYRLVFVTTYLCLTYFAWTIVQLVAHCLSAHPLLLQNLTNDSQQTYTMQGQILAGTLFAGWYAQWKNTKSARIGSNVIALYVTFTWLFDLPFIYQSFNRVWLGNNYYCHGFLDPSTPTPFVNVAPAYWCRVAQASAALAVIFEFGELLFIMHSVYTYATLDKSLLDEESDDTQAAEIEKRPENATGRKLRDVMIAITIAIALLGFVGYCPLTTAYTQVLTTLSTPTTTDPSPASPNPDIVDPVLFDSVHSLVVLFAFSFTLTIYGLFRYSRSLCGAAVLLTASTFFNLWSSYIFYARRVRNGYTGGPNDVDLGSQVAAIVGLGLLLLVQTIRSVTLTVVYFIRYPVDEASRITANHRWLAGEVAEGKHITPSGIEARSKQETQYFRADWDGAHPVCLLLLSLYSLVVFVEFGILFVMQCLPGMFDVLATNPVVGPEMGQEAMLALSHQLQVILAYWVGATVVVLYTERQSTVATAFASFALNAIFASTFWLNVWPATFQGLYRTAVTEMLVCTAADQGLITGTYCSVVKAQAIASLAFEGVQVALCIYSFIHLLMFVLPSRQERFNYHFPSIPIAVATLFAHTITVLGVAVWGLSGAANNIFYGNLYAISVPDNSWYPNAPAEAAGVAASTYPFDAYMQYVQFGELIILTFAVWFGAIVGLSPTAFHTTGYRRLATLLNLLIVCMFCPFFVLVCRYVRDLPLSASQLGMSAGVIVTFAGLVTGAVCCLVVEMQPVDERVGGYQTHVSELLGVDDSKMSHLVTDAAEEDELTRHRV